MQIVTHIYNNKNVVIRNFTIEHFIEVEDHDSDRDKLICEHLKPIKFREKPRYIIERLLANPNEFIAYALREIGAGEWADPDLDLILEAVTVADSHATLYRDFSLIVCSDTLISSHSNIFDFIDNKKYEQYPDVHPVHDLIAKVRSRFGCEHVLYWVKESAISG